MKYSLQRLNMISDLKILNLKNFIDHLNLIGLEVDAIIDEKTGNNFIDEKKILIKVPADRPDLLNEKFFINELSILFHFNLINNWEKLKKKYSFFLKQKYLYYNDYFENSIFSSIPNSLVYLIEVKNLTRKKSPNWIQNKLKEIQIVPKENIFDLLNLCFYEWGQPISFTLNKNLQTESFLKIEILSEDLNYLINNHSFHFKKGTIVLKNNTNTILTPLGFIKSNYDFLENNESSNFFLEAVFYNQFSNKIISEEIGQPIKKLFLENFRKAFQRLLTLLEIVTDAKIIAKKYYTSELLPNLEKTKVLKLSKEKVLKILKTENFVVENFIYSGINLIGNSKKNYYFQIPTKRNDLAREIDLIEEYTKSIGYDKFQEILPKIDNPKFRKNQLAYKFIKNFFLNYGFLETMTNPLDDLSEKTFSSILIANPLNTELSLLRKSLIPKLLEVFETNARTNLQTSNFFEIGRVFKILDNKIIEQDKLSGIFQISKNKNNKQNTLDWFINRGFIENFLQNFGYNNLSIKKINTKNSLFHFTRAIVLKQNEKIIGVFGEINSISQNYNINSKGPIYGFEFNLNHFKDWQMNSKIQNFIEYSKYPTIIKDVGFIVYDSSFNFNSLKKYILSHSVYLRNVTYFDIYSEEQSVYKFKIGIRFEFQSNTETLRNDFIEEELKKIVLLINENFQIYLQL